MTTFQTMTLGYARMGKRRELKKALETFWGGTSSADELLALRQDLEVKTWQAQLTAGIDRIAVGDQTLYDHVLDWTVRLGLIPRRFQGLSGLDRYFAMARGRDALPALEMTKWFDTNYHYLVPEIEDKMQPLGNFGEFLAMVQRSQAVLGDRAVPVVLSPVTLLALSRHNGNLIAWLDRLLPLYVDLLGQLKALGIEEVQLHEPILVTSQAADLKAAVQKTYHQLAGVGLPIQLITYFDDLGVNYGWVTQLPVAGISLDFTRGHNLDLLISQGFPTDKILGAGVVDGRNIWQIHPDVTLALLKKLQAIAPNLRVQPSASLQFVPHDATSETQLPEPLRQVLSFAEQKLTEVTFLARTLAGDETTTQQMAIEQQWQTFKQFNPPNVAVQSAIQKLTATDFQRSLPYDLRLAKQIQLPPLPTTTIGSFPQTKAVRQLRVKYKKGEISQADYQAAIDGHIADCIKLQEDIGLDVLVHGEFERTDMVEYFGQQLQGFAFTVHGWVQSYGSRCVRPPIIYGDVSWLQPMTVREFQVAQSLTNKPVKGMLTGPVTMINWSFTRTDIPRRDQAMQIALALRKEVASLEVAGATLIQVDEPALREGLPLKIKRWQAYLDWAVDAFRLATSAVQPKTQVHTHMCYSEFGDIIEHIERLDADVLSIENSRSNNETLFEITNAGYRYQVGNGVYDVHSPAVPSVEQMVQQLRTGIDHLAIAQTWINPDCGLKTRRWEEVIPALKNMVVATQKLREEIQNAVQ
ncbi:5-methyltetrahydropteroyltriglutamate--homocysteine S-methyltransferase [Picosynechococcus sp. PCC 7117]|uniref:5-methyltetrahydropteroyltriglutamate-- homocysteine S-methyltransferase n=1 Tax=Picosynechococcus sp. PCC 7117 TaxID=195498 RepID=UPI000810D1A5|nr:5-methyltetrahydropteroyltriglutamate--homocysteine S-methyltransferase [Picosynechococcus sp. PCC 7117]ANV89030.1 5-methyltetrahydropteroyltriglutamate--homocysteine S-methyltransferase [Picosynechococcus sp. PCC 7117]